MPTNRSTPQLFLILTHLIIKNMTNERIIKEKTINFVNQF